jgi:hypothetical protein
VPKVTILVDTERSYLSVSHLVRSPSNPGGHVIRVRAPKYADVLDAIQSLRRQALPDTTTEDYGNLGAVVIDTASRLADTTRRALVAETEIGTDLWKIRDKLFPAQRDWGNMSDMLARVFEVYGSYADQQGIPFIMLCHESKRTDEATGALKGGPDANPKLLSEIVENSDYVWRIWREEAAVKLGDKSYPKNTHFLRMTTSEAKMTKMRLPPEYSEKLIDNLPNPTLQTAFAQLGPFIPNVLTVFGPPGAGKTTFACTLSAK